MNIKIDKPLRYISIFILIFFVSCVDEVQLDPLESESVKPVICFQNEDVKHCEGEVIPENSDFTYLALPSGIELNFPNSLEFSINFSSLLDKDSISDNLIILRDKTVVDKDNYEIIVKGYNLTIKPKESWERGKYRVVLLKGIKDSKGKEFVESIPFYYAKERKSLITEEKRSIISSLTDEQANSLEFLRNYLIKDLEFLESELDKERDDFLMIVDYTLKGEFIPCFQAETEKCSEIVPLPSDFLMGYDENLGIHIDLPIADSNSDYMKKTLAGINKLDGWGIVSPFTITLTSPIKEESLKDGVKVFKVNQDLTQIDEVTIDSFLIEDGKRLIIKPENDNIWDESSKYFIVLTDSLKDVDDNPLVKSKVISFLITKDKLIDDDKKSIYNKALSDEDANNLEKLRVLFSPFLDKLSEENIKREDISMIWSVTTQSATTKLAEIATSLSDDILDPAPTLNDKVPSQYIPIAFAREGINLEEVVEQLGYDHKEELYENIEFFIRGKYKSPNYMKDGVWKASWIPNNPQEEELTFYLTIPMDMPGNEFCSKMPDNGFPVVIFQHGFTRQKSDIFAMANFYAKHCYATIAIDAVKHGDRMDGDAVESGDHFFNSDLLATRDNFRQSVVDLLQLKRAITKIKELDDNELPGILKLDESKVSYFGISLGGIIGTIFMTVAPDVKVGVLNVPGGGLVDILVKSRSEHIKGPIVEMLEELGIEENSPQFRQFMFFAQLLLDRADPLSYGKRTILNPIEVNGFKYPAKDIFMERAIDDEVIDNYTTEHLAKVMGIYDTEYFKDYGSFEDPPGHGFAMYNSVYSQAAKMDSVNFYNSKLGE